MNKNIDRALEHYSKATFQNDLKNLEKDVYGRIHQSQLSQNKGTNAIEKWFGIPATLGGSIMASTLILGVFFGTQVQTEHVTRDHDGLGFEVFSAESSKLPSSLLVPEL